MSIEYNEAWDVFLDKMGENTPEIEMEFYNGWKSCKESVLKILKQPIQNADLSWEEVDKLENL